MKKILLALLLLGATCHAIAQEDTASMDDLSKELNANADNKPHYVMSTFKGTRIINGQSVQSLGKGLLDFRISHRFGQLNQGAKNFFGLDNATTKIGFDYGITSWLTVGIGHSTYLKEDDGFVKVRILRQREDGGAPVTLSYVGAMSIQTGPHPPIPAGDTYYFSNRLYYTNQLLVARKFNNWLSLQVMPTIVHYNLVDSSKYSNDLLAIGVGGSIRLSRRFALTGEYYYVVPGTGQDGYHNSLSVGVDIETGGHVFQLHFTNSTAVTERTFIGQTTDDWAKGQLHFGFNISRVFTIARPKEFKNTRNKIW